MNENLYYITLPGREPLGPVSMDALRVMARNGALTAQHLYCTEGAQEWRPITELVIIHSATPVVPPLSGGSVTTGAEKQNTYLVPAIVMLVLSLIMFYLSILFAVLAVVYASMAESAASAGNVIMCRKHAQTAKIWCIVTGIVLGLQVLLIPLLFLIIFLSSVSSI